MVRVQLMKALIFAITLFSPTLCGAVSQPNILLLVAEDLSPRIGAFGDPVAHTPNIDELARDGVRYRNTFSTAGVCAPSRAALITGVHQNALGAGHMRSHNWAKAKYMAVPPPEIKAFPELLRAAGYFTYVTAKLDYQFSGHLPGSGPFTIWDSESTSVLGTSWRDRGDERPFFGMYAFMETHESGLFPRCCWPRSLTQVFMGMLHTVMHWGTEKKVRPEQVSVPPYYPDTTTIRRDIAQQYNNSITMDRLVGEVLQQLEDDGLAESTIVIWTTDHGDGLPRAKRELYDSGIKVPMVIRWPEKFRPEGVAAGDVDERLISFVDIAPTILTMAGVEVPDFVQGRQFLTGEKRDPRKYVYAAADRMDEARDRQRAVRDAQFKYIRNDFTDRPGAKHLAFRDNLDSMRELWKLHATGMLDEVQSQWFENHPPEELYDTLGDPYEITNLARDPLYAGVLIRMRGALENWQERVIDFGAIPESELAATNWPNGERPTTAAPIFTTLPDGRTITVTASTPGASIGYRINGGQWMLYSGPIYLPPGSELSAKAVRYGWAESAESVLTVN